MSGYDGDHPTMNVEYEHCNNVLQHARYSPGLSAQRAPCE